MRKIGYSFATSFLLSLLLYPIDTSKRIIQMNGARGSHLKYNDQMEFLRETMAKKQFGSLYRGVHLFAVKEVLIAFTQYSLFEALFQQ